MSHVTTRTLALLGVAGVAVPLTLMVGRAYWAVFVSPVPMAVLALDMAVVGAGTIVVVSLLGMQLQSAMARPLDEVTGQVTAISAGRFDELAPPSGPAEARRLAVAVNDLAQRMERQIHAITQQSGIVAIGTVLNGVAHEVSNPLTSIRLSTQLLRDKARTQEDTAMMRQLERILRGLTRLERVVVALRVAGSPEGEHPPEHLVDAALIVAQRAIMSCDLDLDRAASRPVQCRAGDLVQALAALLQNAGESGATHLRVQTRDEEGAVAIVITDDGPGLPTAVAKHVLEPFVTTKPGRPGLGLDLASRIAKEHGGSLTASDAEAGGARIELRIPRAP